MKFNKQNIIINLVLSLLTVGYGVMFNLPDMFFIVIGLLTGIMFPILEVVPKETKDEP